MLIGQVDIAAILSATIPLAIAIVGGGLTMAWRLGGLEKTVKELNDDVKELKGQVRDLSRIDRSLRR